MSNGLTLADILARGVSIEWHEGVALLRAVAERLRERSGQEHIVPEPHQIVLSPTGQVDVTGGTRVEQPVRRLGQLLQATVGRSDPPVQLRLIISQATAPSPGFASIREYDDAVGYFERPNRLGLLQDLYGRAAAAPPASASTPQPRLDTIAPLPAPEGSKKTGTPAAKKAGTPGASKSRPRIILATLAVLLVLACAAGLQYARMAGAVPKADEVSVLAQQARDALGAAVVSGLSAMTEAAGLGRLVSADPEPVEPPVTAAAPPRSAPGAGGAAPIPSNAEVPLFVAFDLDPVPANREVSAMPAPVSSTSGPASEPSAGNGEAPDDLTIYSVESEGVLPAVGVRPQFARELPSDMNWDDLGHIELVIGLDGTVDSVRLLGSPRNVHDSMLLSVAKAWHFHPALKDGRPVRYRKTVWIAAQ